MFAVNLHPRIALPGCRPLTAVPTCRLLQHRWRLALAADALEKGDDVQCQCTDSPAHTRTKSPQVSLGRNHKEWDDRATPIMSRARIPWPSSARSSDCAGLSGGNRRSNLNSSFIVIVKRATNANVGRFGGDINSNATRTPDLDTVVFWCCMEVTASCLYGNCFPVSHPACLNHHAVFTQALSAPPCSCSFALTQLPGKVTWMIAK